LGCGSGSRKGGQAIAVVAVAGLVATDAR